MRWIRATKYFLPSLLRSGKSHFMNGYGQKFFLQNNVPIYILLLCNMSVIGQTNVVTLT